MTPFDNYFTSQSKPIEDWKLRQREHGESEAMIIGRSDADHLGGCPFPEGSEDAKEWRKAKTETEAARRKR